MPPSVRKYRVAMAFCIFCENGHPIQVRTLSDLSGGSQPARQHTLPDIRDFFFAKIRFQTPTANPNWWQNVQGIAQSWNGQVIDGQNQVYVHRNPQERQQAQRNLQAAVQGGLLPLAPEKIEMIGVGTGVPIVEVRLPKVMSFQTLHRKSTSPMPTNWTIAIGNFESGDGFPAGRRMVFA
jgi:hypothetical protein